MLERFVVLATCLLLAALLFTSGCVNSVCGTCMQQTDSAVGTWVQKGNAYLLLLLLPDGNALIRLRMPDEGPEAQYINRTGHWLRTGPDRISVQYEGPISAESRTLQIVIDMENEAYLDKVVNANGTVIGPPDRTHESKMHFVRI